MLKKSYIAVILTMILSMVLLSGCGGSNSSTDLSDSKYVGTWKASTMALMDESETVDGEWILTFNGD